MNTRELMKLETDRQKVLAQIGVRKNNNAGGDPRPDPDEVFTDYGQEEEDDLLGNAAKPDAPEELVHPLAKYVDFGDQPMAPRWVIPGFIGHGVVAIAGAHGVGKTTALLPLAMTAAGLHAPGDPLGPEHWRHVIYIVEDVEQARRILAGVIKFGGYGLNVATVRERLHLVEARRLEPAYIAEVAATYKAQFTRSVSDVDVLPLVVFDTKSAVFALTNENDNSENSLAVAALKQDFCGLPSWVVGHVNKQDIGRSDAAGLSMRGGSSFEADGNQCLFLVKDGEQRYLVRGKTRFEAKWPELEIQSVTATTNALDEFGNSELMTLRWGVAVPPTQSRKDAKQEAQEAADKAEAAALRDDVRNEIQLAWQAGMPLNRGGVKSKIKRRSEVVGACIENLLNERWLHEVEVPKKERKNSRRSVFLVNLTTEEHEAALRGEGMPLDKLVIPPSWKKESIPSVPNVAPATPQKASK